MKRLGLITVCTLILLVSVPSFTSVSGYTPPVVYSGTSPIITYYHAWDLGIGYVGAGQVIKWNWTPAGGNVTFQVAYTRTSDYQTVQVPDLLEDDGIVANVTGWYNLNWFNFRLPNVTLSYRVEVYTPAVSAVSVSEGAYLNSRTVEIRGTTEGFATGVLVGTDSLHLHKASLSGSGWTTTVALAEGRNAIIMQSYYWLRPLGTVNASITRTVNVTVDTVMPLVSVVSPSNGTSIRGRDVRVRWNCSDAVGLSTVDLRVDNGTWATVERGDTLGIGYTPLGLSSGRHVIEVRGTDRAGNQVSASTTIRVDANDWSLGGPMYGLPTIGIILAAIALAVVAFLTLARPPKADTPPAAPLEPAQAPPASEPKGPGQP